MPVFSFLNLLFVSFAILEVDSFLNMNTGRQLSTCAGYGYTSPIDLKWSLQILNMELGVCFYPEIFNNFRASNNQDLGANSATNVSKNHWYVNIRFSRRP
jgi:hypothetical protein